MNVGNDWDDSNDRDNDDDRVDDPLWRMFTFNSATMQTIALLVTTF